MARIFDQHTMIHPLECPCPLCLMQESVPLDIFTAQAGLEDVISVLLEEITNGTFYDSYMLTRHIIYNSPDKEVRMLQQNYS